MSDSIEFINKRAIVKHDWQDFSYFDSVKCEYVLGLSQLKVTFPRFEMCYTEFDVVQSQIESVDKSELCVSERVSFEDTYFSLVVAAESFLKWGKIN